MGAPMTETDSRPIPSAVLGAKIDFLIEEFRDLRRAAVPRGEYDIARAADLARLTVVEAQLKQQGDRRWQVALATLGAVLGLVSSIVTAFVAAGH
jgi:hypothetical protein